MKTKAIHYKVKMDFPFTVKGTGADMLRYSQDEIEKLISEDEAILVHVMTYESEKHLKDREEFFHSMIVGRWKSFGATVTIIPER